LSYALFADAPGDVIGLANMPPPSEPAKQKTAKRATAKRTTAK
jgi:hypothetical protein